MKEVRIGVEEESHGQIGGRMRGRGVRELKKIGGSTPNLQSDGIYSPTKLTKKAS